MLNKAAEELPSESDITGADEIELREIAEKALGISKIKDVQTDTDDLFEHPFARTHRSGKTTQKHSRFSKS